MPATPHRIVRAAASAGLLVLLLAGAGCRGGDATAELLVGAASDLALAMPDLAAAFEEETGIRVNATLGSSGQLAQQVLQGAPLDVLLSADHTWIQRIEDAGRVAPGGRAVYAHGRLVLVTAAHRAPITSIERLGDAGIGRIALANPDHAPYGRAAREALQSAGLWDRVQDRLVIAENVRQTLQFVGTGNVDAAISALPLMGADDGRWTGIPDSLHQPLVQEAAAIAGRPLQEHALRFVAFLDSDRAREILARHRFVLPGRAP